MKTDHIPPQNIEAEEAVLAACLFDREALEDFAILLNPDDFYRSAHQIIFDVCSDLLGRGEPVDAVSVASELKARAKLDAAGGHGYIAKLLDAPPPPIRATMLT